LSVQQIETATVVGTVTGAGNAAVIITSAYMTNSPKTFNVAMAGSETADQAAALIRNALVYDADVSAQFIVSGATDKVILTAHTARANDTTLNISITNGTCSGLTPALTSADTLAGVGIANGYATLAEYKSWVAVRGLAGAVGTDTSDDGVIELLIESASRYFDRETGKRFYLNGSDETRYYTTDDPYEVKIDPLGTLTSISIDTSGTRSYAALTATDYDLLPVNAALDGEPYTRIAISQMLSGNTFPTFVKGVQVIGKFGYPSVPTDVKEAALSIAQSLNGSRSGQTSGGKMTITAAGIVIRPEDVPAFAQKIIRHYRSLV
jgi:hypothetical protein